MASEKVESIHEVSEFESHVGEPRRSGTARIAESVRLALTILTILMAMSIVGTTADSLAVYNKTHVADDFLLPLWPVQFNLGPTIALVTGASIIAFSSAISLIMTKVSALRNKALIHSLLSLLAPSTGFIASLVATSFFYSINASNTVDTLQSWTCRWTSVPMNSSPHWDVLCKESKAALYMMIIMIPLQLIVLGLAGFSYIAEKKVPFTAERKGSPAMS